MARKALVVRTLMGLLEPAIRSRADRLFILVGGRQGSKKRIPTISNYYETGLVVALYEHLLMSPDLSHMEIAHEVKYKKKTKPEQVDLWIRSPKGGSTTVIECGDFTAKKVKDDASKMRRLNPSGTNWFLAFFRDDLHAKDPWARLRQCRSKKGSLKGKHLGIEKKFTGTFEIRLPNDSIYFGWALIRVQ